MTDFQRRDRAFAAVEPKFFRADIFAREKLFPLLSFDDLAEDRLLAFGREVNGLVLPLDPLLDEAPLVQVVDVHVFDADGAAVIRLQDSNDLAHARPFEPQRPADPDRAVEVVGAEAVIFRRQVGREVRPVQTQRIELRRKMPAHPIGADQHHRADRIFRCAAYRFAVRGRSG